MVAISKRLL